MYDASFTIRAVAEAEMLVMTSPVMTLQARRKKAAAGVATATWLASRNLPNNFRPASLSRLQMWQRKKPKTPSKNRKGTWKCSSIEESGSPTPKTFVGRRVPEQLAGSVYFTA